MNFDFLFILTYGRSGSTLLQGLLNAIDGVVIRGENAGALRGLFYSLQRLKFAREKFAGMSGGPKTLFFGISEIDLEDYIVALRDSFVRCVLRPQAGASVVGFKEIRYHDCDLEQEINLFRQFFPRCGFIVNTRQIDDAIASSIKAGHNVTPEVMRQADAALRRLGDGRFGDVFRVHYDDYIREPDILRPLFEFIGTRYDRNKVIEVMRQQHSTRSR